MNKIFLLLIFAVLVNAAALAQQSLSLTALVSFNGTNGSYPYGPLVVGPDGNFYGTTSSGGTSNAGTVFRISPQGQFTNLVSFSGGTNLNYPYSPLAFGSDGSLYGIAVGGGSFFQGGVFKISTNGTLAQLVSFDGTNAYYTYQGLKKGPDGNFYFCSRGLGAAANGSIMRLTPNGTLNPIALFSSTNGTYPGELIVTPNGDMYGVAIGGGAYGYGTVFKATTNGGLTTVVSFNFATGGKYPNHILMAADGKLY